MSSYPPARTIPSIPISNAVALKYLTAYLDLTPSNPYLLPNAKLESSGPTTGASNSSITISNLQRLQAGLRGDWLPPVFDLDENVEVAAGLADEPGQSELNGEEWQNLEDYQLEQEEIEGEVAPTPTVVRDDDEEFVEDEEVVKRNAKSLKRKHDGVAGESEQVAKKPKDKETRKAEKKERKKAEQREKIKARAAAKAAENA